MELSFLALAGFFLAGLALNLTPCVYPMLSVTVALFGGPEKKPVPVAFGRALLYVLGMAVMYSTLGLIAALTGGFFGAAIQNQWVLLGMALLMFVLALSMFGLYEFQMPEFLLSWAGGSRRAGNIGIFVSGLVVGIFAAPCIGPPIVALLTIVGQSANPFSGFVAFFILALGLGLPYLVLGTFSGFLRKLPKSGEWLIWIKKVFGVLLLGLALFYLSLSIYPSFLPFVIPTALAAGGAYLGFLDPTGDKSILFKRVKQAGGAIAIIAAGLIIFAKPTEGVVWEPYKPEKISAALKAGKPVVIDFFADWCIPCHELEHYTYTNPEVIQALEPFVRLKVDATNPTTAAAMEPIDQFEILGVPTVLFLDPTGREVDQSRITGYVPPKIFLESVRPFQSKGKEERNGSKRSS